VVVISRGADQAFQMGDADMGILVVDGNNKVRIERPYVNKYGPNRMIENSIWIGETDEIRFTDNEAEAFSLLTDHEFHSLIISTGGDVDGCYLLDRVRSTGKHKNIPVMII
jgi:CheY-like chemotaxis protein